MPGTMTDPETTVWIVTPAHGRLAISEIAFAQRRRMMDELARDGVDVRCVVVACDENLELATAQGFDTIEAPNGQLGRRFNDGIEHALSEGADYVLPLGSDDWLHPDYLIDLPGPDEPIRTVTRTVIIREDGLILGRLHVTYEGGCGFRCYPRWLLERAGGRPANDRKSRSVDTSIKETIEQRAGRIAWAPYEWELARVGFKSPEQEQLNAYRNVYASYGVGELDDPWSRLAEWYPPDLVDRAREVYGV